MSNFKKINIVVISSPRSTSTGLSPKNFANRADPIDLFHDVNILFCIGILKIYYTGMLKIN